MDSIFNQVGEVLDGIDTSHLDSFETYLRRFLASMIGPEWQKCELSQALLPTGGSVYVATLEAPDSDEDGGVGLYEPEAVVRVAIVARTARGELRICPPSPVQDERAETSEPSGPLTVGCVEQISHAMLEASTLVQQSNLRKRHKKWICEQFAHACRHLGQMLENS